MNPQRLVGLYPAAWRSRYQDEFLALLEERPPTRAQVLDIAWGAIDAHLFPQAPEGRFRMFTRIAGAAAVAAGILLAIGSAVGVPPDINQYTVPAIYVLIVIGIVGVHLRQVTVRPGLAWFGFAAMIVPWLVGILAMLLSWAGVLPPSGGEFAWAGAFGLWIGSTVFGATMLAIRVFPMPVGLAITIAAPLAMIGLALGKAEASADVLNFLSRAGIVLYGLGWVGAGLSMLTAQPREGVLGTA
jgi:hypothetical protein